MFDILFEDHWWNISTKKTDFLVQNSNYRFHGVCLKKGYSTEQYGILRSHNVFTMWESKRLLGLDIYNFSNWSPISVTSVFASGTLDLIITTWHLLCQSRLEIKENNVGLCYNWSVQPRLELFCQENWVLVGEISLLKFFVFWLRRLVRCWQA